MKFLNISQCVVYITICLTVLFWSVTSRETSSVLNDISRQVAQNKNNNNKQVASVSAPASASASAPITTTATSCVVTEYANVAAAVSSCSEITIDGVFVPAGKTLDLTGLADNAIVYFAGNTTFGYELWTGPLISIKGTGVKVIGLSGHVIDGQGAKWWDGKGSNGGKKKPKFFAAHNLVNSNISYLNVLNTPVQGFSISGCTNVALDHITLNNAAGSVNNIGHNTDAFDVGTSTGVVITNAWVHNQDDCLAVNSVDGLRFENNYCAGGHGASIGSVGLRSDNVVENVYINNINIVDSQNGVRVKTIYDATGSVKNVTYSNIVLNNISNYGIVVEGDYENGSPKGTPTGGVPITQLYLHNVTGTVAKGGINKYILVENASEWVWTDIDVIGGTKHKNCTGIPANSGASC